MQLIEGRAKLFAEAKQPLVGKKDGANFLALRFSDPIPQICVVSVMSFRVRARYLPMSL
jgi:hypothetical protein